MAARFFLALAIFQRCQVCVPGTNGRPDILRTLAISQANRRAQFHHGLIPIAGRFSGEQFLRRNFQLPPNRGARSSPRTAPNRARTRATFPSSTASGFSYAMLRTAAAV